MSRQSRASSPIVVESIDEWLSRGNRITTCQPGVSGHVTEWESLAGRIDNCPPPLCADVTVSSWTVGSDVASAITEATQESNQEIY